MLKLHVKNRTLTAFGLRPLPDAVQKHVGAVSRKPIADPDALGHELYGLTEDEIRIVEGGET